LTTDRKYVHFFALLHGFSNFSCGQTYETTYAGKENENRSLKIYTTTLFRKT